MVGYVLSRKDSLDRKNEIELSEDLKPGKGKGTLGNTHLKILCTDDEEINSVGLDLHDYITFKLHYLTEIRSVTLGPPTRVFTNNRRPE